jgi:archaellum component FlaF (FlaF/FlaG flagellin family)
MKKINGLPVYVLSAALVLSSIIYSAEASSAPQYVTIQKYNKDLKQIVTELLKVQYRVDELESCLSNTTRTLTQSGRVTQWCP